MPECHCHPCYSGAICDIPKPDPCANNGACGAHGTCAYDQATCSNQYCVCDPGYTGPFCIQILPTPPLPRDCYDIYQTTAVDGVYAIQLPNNNAVEVLCDLTGGGWTVIQSRTSDGMDFNRLYDQYKSDFGNPGSSFWLGLENIHSLTAQNATPYALKIDLCCHSAAKAETYDYFYVADSADKYRLNVSSGTGNAGDGFNYIAYTFTDNGSQFSTFDNYNGQFPAAGLCTSFGGNGGWWFGSCTSNLNGFLSANSSDYDPQTCELIAIPTNGPGLTWNTDVLYTKARMKVIRYSQLPSLIRDSAYEHQQLAAFCSF
uniref:Fibrinogen C-terminal domain-containing protein n=1 Tax=Plectus sambesii TaxID=2011161 RepID=A0A914WNA9_9BILA